MTTKQLYRGSKLMQRLSEAIAAAFFDVNDVYFSSVQTFYMNEAIADTLVN